MATGDALDDVERRARVAVVGTARELEGDGPKDFLSAGGPYGSTMLDWVSKTTRPSSERED